jgi:hypothetical protein
MTQRGSAKVEVMRRWVRCNGVSKLELEACGEWREMWRKMCHLCKDVGGVLR